MSVVVLSVSKWARAALALIRSTDERTTVGAMTERLLVPGQMNSQAKSWPGEVESSNFRSYAGMTRIRFKGRRNRLLSAHRRSPRMVLSMRTAGTEVN
jgi:hypothetical protein